ncbi:MAG: hypothetical protein IJ812_00935 [Schwartzia sp.]|nr:hypothetical protein [Schwartzia sp. (in: firmicutes)]MBR1759649.1 hypothetical protein [Schwartzia sp. (in: firmicutes)]MBR1884949.1 hypothetical protein [Schwartzia sp. (in: firmicutes)]
MRCEKCGAELGDNNVCPACGTEDPRVTVLTRAERNAYTGITIEEGAPERESGPDIRFERRGGGRGGFSYMTGGSWQGKLTLILGAAAILLFVFFIALPVALAALVFGVISWILYQFMH